jgi:hypothetical protein
MLPLTDFKPDASWDSGYHNVCHGCVSDRVARNLKNEPGVKPRRGKTSKERPYVRNLTFHHEKVLTELIASGASQELRAFQIDTKVEFKVWWTISGGGGSVEVRLVTRSGLEYALWRVAVDRVKELTKYLLNKERIRLERNDVDLIQMKAEVYYV